MIINTIFTIVMLMLALIDITSTKTQNHKDFKAIILTLGVLGTFVGVFIGLLNFDVNAMETSIPLLLNGLKIAFYTSIIGMGLSVLISIYQRFIGFKVEDKDSLDFINLQIKKLDKLDNLEMIFSTNNDIKENLISLNKITTAAITTNANLADKIEESMQNLIKTIKDSSQNTNSILLSINKNISDDLIKQFQELRFAITMQIEKLSSDFSADLICQINNLQEAYIQTIETHFSQNFKRFNNAMANLLQWQKSSKEDMEKTSEILNKSAILFENVSSLTNSILERDERTIRLYEEVSSIMQEYKEQNENLLEKLREMKNLGNSASEAIKFIDTFFGDLNKYLKTTNANLAKDIKNTNEMLMNNLKSTNNDFVLYAKDINKTIITTSQKMIKEVFALSISELEKANKKLLEDFNARNNDLQKQLNSSSKQLEHLNKESQGYFNTSLKNIDSLNTAMQKTTANIADGFVQLNKDIEIYTRAVSTNTSEMISNINKDGIKHLKNTTKLYFSDISNIEHKILSNMSNQNTEYLKSLDSTLLAMSAKFINILEEITNKSLNEQKDLNLENLAQLKSLNDNISNFVKDNTILLNKSNLELLKMLDILQKQVDMALRKSNESNAISKDSIKNIKDSMAEISDGFKGDYEWFLRRVREIIGQRM